MPLPTTTAIDVIHTRPAFGAFSFAPLARSAWFDPAQDDMLVAIDAAALSKLDLPNVLPSFHELWDAQDDGIELDGVECGGEEVRCVCMYDDDSCALFGLFTESRESDDPLFFVQSPDDCSVKGQAYRDAIRECDGGDSSGIEDASGTSMPLAGMRWRR